MNSTRRRRRANPAAGAGLAEGLSAGSSSRLVYGFSRRAGARVVEAQGIERHLIALFALILCGIAIEIWIVGAWFTIHGVLALGGALGISLSYSGGLWVVPVIITIAEVGLKRPRMDLFFAAWLVAFSIDAATTALGILPLIRVGGPVPTWSYALLFGAIFAWSAEAIGQAGLYTLWRYWRHG